MIIIEVGIDVKKWMELTQDRGNHRALFNVTLNLQDP